VTPLQPAISRVVRGGVLLALAALCGAAGASATQCSTSGGAWYCQYSGTVAAAYVNYNNEVILYFDTPVAPSTLSAAGISGVSIYNAAIYEPTNLDFAKQLYASLLTAQARGATVSVQMSSTSQGYLQMDRIWVYP